jgi:glyceraldehyde 3-phosphate dehydrogenase
MARVAINGLGRIGRATLKIVLDTPGLDLVAANDIGAPENLVYLLKYDTVYGRYEKTVAASPDASLTIGAHWLALLSERNPSRLPWKSLGVDIVFECTGAFTTRKDLEAHVEAGARYVILSAPSRGEDVETVVHGVNTPDGNTTIISCASCTTNCITPVMEILGRRIGIKKAIMATVHAYTASQAIVDSPHRHVRRGRAGAANLVPMSTGAAIASAKALPEYRGRFDGVLWRARHCRITGRHRGRRRKTNDTGRGEPRVCGGSRERTLSWSPGRHHGSIGLIRHRQRSARLRRGPHPDPSR